jgi:hypothetical protein
MFGGRGGIRTHGTVSRTAVFKTAALNHSATLPALVFVCFFSFPAGQFVAAATELLRTPLRGRLYRLADRCVNLFRSVGGHAADDPAAGICVAWIYRRSGARPWSVPGVD